MEEILGEKNIVLNIYYLKDFVSLRYDITSDNTMLNAYPAEGRSSGGEKTGRIHPAT